MPFTTIPLSGLAPAAVAAVDSAGPAAPAARRWASRLQAAVPGCFLVALQADRAEAAAPVQGALAAPMGVVVGAAEEAKGMEASVVVAA